MLNFVVLHFKLTRFTPEPLNIKYNESFVPYNFKLCVEGFIPPFYKRYQGNPTNTII